MDPLGIQSRLQQAKKGTEHTAAALKEVIDGRTVPFESDRSLSIIRNASEKNALDHGLRVV